MLQSSAGLGFSYKMASNQSTSTISTPEAPVCEHQEKEESLQEIIETLDWKIQTLEEDLDDLDYELSWIPEYFGKYDHYDTLSEEKRMVEKEVTTCTKMIEDIKEKAHAENCFCCRYV